MKQPTDLMERYDVDARIERIMASGIYLKQNRKEIDFAFHHVAAHVGIVETFVEIGSMEGASLYVYGGLVPRNGTVIALDDCRRKRTRRNLKRAIELLKNAEGIDAKLLRGDSHKPETLDALKTMLGGKLIDFLHIDGDHSAAGSLLDWEMYSPLVRPGGIVAFHDIRGSAPCHVDKTWLKVCDTGRLTRVTSEGRWQWANDSKLHKPCGIGLVYM